MTLRAEKGFCHRVAVRYGEVDLQGVVFNAHYLAYCDDAVETWFRQIGFGSAGPGSEGGPGAEVGRHGWDFMLKKVVVEWQGSAGLGDLMTIDVAVSRWGRTSFDVGFVGTVKLRPVFTATITYVGVAAGTKTPMEPPPSVREALGDAPPPPTAA